MEEELRLSEQADREQKIAAMEAAAPVAALPGVPDSEPEHPHLPAPETDSLSLEPPPSAAEPLPIASSGSLDIMPPATGLPTPRELASANNLTAILDSIPVAEPEPPAPAPAQAPAPAEESAIHG